MNASEKKAIARLDQYRAAGADLGMVARTVSALIRAAATRRSREALLAYAAAAGVTRHVDFVI